MSYPYYWSDNGFPYALEQTFKRVTSAQQPDEIRLFRALQYSFEELSSDFSVEVLHGNRSQVSYSTKSSWADPSGTEQCELCDLLIVSFRAKPFALRMTCLQNKADQRIGGLPDKFKADLVQLELLSVRPRIVGRLKFAPPANLLSGALLPSIGSYGVFYRDAVGEYDMAYRIASELALPTGGRSPARQVGSLLAPPFVRVIGGHPERIGAATLCLFAMDLAMLRIGTPLQGHEVSGSAEHTGYRATIRKWLGGMIKARLRSVAPEYLLRASGPSSTLLELLGGASDDNDNLSDEGPDLVLLQIDGRMGRRT
ncbi:MAG: hypothetical protein IPJ56_10025 [Gemmatimonadetes bacterium]|nr:hypothetical protein [Gemmatimonadota bacterium]